MGIRVDGLEWYKLVPKGYKENLRWRIGLLDMARNDRRVAKQIIEICKEDPLFWINSFVWTFNPRLPTKQRKLPFITWPYQDEVILQLIEATGLWGGEPYDIVIEKSRDMGASWMCVVADAWQWQFYEYSSFLWVSRKRELVDQANDPDTLFWKLDFILAGQPSWLRPKVDRKQLHCRNENNGSVIDGDTTTGDVGRGGRRTAVLLDEFAAFEVKDGYAALAATADTTDSRRFNSTPKGTGNAFYDVREKAAKETAGAAKLIRLHWTLHPEKSKGLYEKDGKKRSIWYDKEDARRVSKLEMAQEVDIDYLASGSQFYDQDALMKLQAKYCRDPYIRGTLIYDKETGEFEKFVRSSDGEILLWTLLDAENLPNESLWCAMGVDVSAGSDASNSVISVGDVKTGEKICEVAVIRMYPHELAVYAVALARWFGGVGRKGADGKRATVPQRPVMMCWEANGPGQEFGNIVLKLGYYPIYYRRKETNVSKKITDQPGWWSSGQAKTNLIAEHRRALLSEKFITRSLQAYKEAAEYVYGPDTVPTFGPAMGIQDPSGAKHNHGDRVVSEALCWKAMQETHVVQEEDKPQVPASCFGRRREERLARERALTEW